MTAQHDSTVRRDSATEQCWKTIGVMGDRSCPELAAAVHCRNCPVFIEAGQRLFERRPPEDYIRQQTAQLSEEPARQAAGSQPMIIFRIGEEWLALDVESVVEVAQPRPAHRVPHRSDRLLEGIVNIRGELQLCISLGELLGIQGTERTSDEGAAKNRLLVVEREAGRWAFAVDEVAGVHRIAVEQLGNVPSTVAKSIKRFSRAVFLWEGNSVGQLDEGRLFKSLKGSIG